MIVPMEKKHAPEVGKLHHLYVGSFLKDLGEQMCINFYKIALDSPHNFGFVSIENSEVWGFTFATTDNSQLFKNLRMLFVLGLALLQKPWFIKRLLLRTKTQFPPTPERLYSATDLKIRGKGIGRKLYLALEEEFKSRGMIFYEIRIDADNVVNIELSKKLGSTIIEEFMEDGIRRCRLRKTLE